MAIRRSSITINYHETATSSITDLTGTKWLLNETIEYDSGFPTYDINFNAYCESDAVASLSGLYMEAVAGPGNLQSVRIPSEPGSEAPLYCLRYNSGETIDFYNFWIGSVLYTGNGTTSMTNSANDSTFNGELFNRTIEITGGTDATNTNLIAWLQANATQIVEPAGNSYGLTHSLTNLSHDNITIQITPDTGYTYPANITVTNGTLISYDSATGVAVISGDDTTVVSGECVEQASGCEVELYGYTGDGETVYVQINDDPTWYYAELQVAGGGFAIYLTNIPNAYEKSSVNIGIPNVSKIKIGTAGDPTQYTGPQYYQTESTGDFTNLTFTSTGGSAPAYATDEITMTQNSRIAFSGDD